MKLAERIDPRLSVLGRRLASVRAVLPIMSHKGGVGKTVISTALAFALAADGRRVGLFDADLANPTIHVVLGLPLDVKPAEERGVLPVDVEGIKFMSAAFYTMDSPMPFRGFHATDALKELFAITRWEGVEYLIIDMPPGAGDEQMDLLEWLREKARVLVVATPSALAMRGALKTLALVREHGVEVLGLVVNMYRGERLDAMEGLRQLAVYRVPYVEGLESYMGSPQSWSRSPIVHGLSDLARAIASG
ncbi:MAG: P-loop NTPase [Desulfurococcaceae archaeon]